MNFSLMILEFLWQEFHFLPNTNSITLTKSVGILQNQENETLAWEGNSAMKCNAPIDTVWSEKS